MTHALLQAEPVDNEMQLASYIGALNPPRNSSASIPVTCTTGNCTFPTDGNATFNSLTLCSKTWDATDEIETKPPTNISHWVFSLGYDNTIEQGAPFLFNTSSTRLPDTSRKDSGGNIWNTTSLLDVFILSMTKINETARNCTPPACIYDTSQVAAFTASAWTFSLFPCVQTFSASVTGGIYTEEVISEQYLNYLYRRNRFQLSMNSTIFNGTWKSCDGTNEATHTNTIPVYLPDDRQPNAYYQPECVFEFTPSQMSEFLGDTFFVQDGRSESTWVDKLWRNGTTDTDLVTNFAQGLATSIGAEMRKKGTGPEMLREVRGTTLVSKTCIRVHWGYLSFFATIFVLELVFLAAVVALTHRSRLHTDWKSSTLAVAFLSGGRARRSEWPVDNAESEESLQKAAKNVKVSLVGETGDWRLRTEPDANKILVG